LKGRRNKEREKETQNLSSIADVLGALRFGHKSIGLLEKVVNTRNKLLLEKFAD